MIRHLARRSEQTENEAVQQHKGGWTKPLRGMQQD